MKKVININFQGRVIPIEESAFELLKQYIESLRRYFAGEEGREEIINDIQDRIGELFNDCIKAGATCITDADLGKIIDNMGRPEDFEAAENSFADQMGSRASGSETAGGAAGATGAGASGGTMGGSRAGGAGFGPTEKTTGSQGTYEPRGRLYRNESDKVLGGVCSGLANYLKIDPVIIRILYVIMVFGSFGAAVLVYFVLWVVLPTQNLDPTIRKRLFRNPEDRMIGGVCGGIAAYFNIEVWIPRLIFAAPFLFGVVGAILRVAFWWQWHDFPITVFNGFGGSLLVVYIILWAVLPEARTASERLEMRGAKVDLESIKASVQEELQGLKERAKKAGGEFSEKAQAWGEELKTGSRKFAKEAAPAARRSGSGVLRAIGMLFKIFFMIIAGIIAFSILMALIAVLFGSIGAYPLADIFLQGFWPHFFFWSTLILFLGIPVIAIFHWIIRMIIGRRSENNYFRYIFATLWLLGFVSAICLAGTVLRSLSAGNEVIEQASVTQPSKNGLVVRVRNEGISTDSWNWGVQLNGLIENNGDEFLHVYNVRMNVGQSPDASYHVEIQKHSRGTDPVNANDNATRIKYAFTQEDSILYLPRTLELTPGQPFRGQGVRVNVLVPIGKHIFLDESLNRLQAYNVRIWKNKWDNHNWDGDDWDDNDFNWETNVDYIMTKDGLVRADGKKVPRFSDEDNNDDNKDEDDNKDDDDDKKTTPHASDSTNNADHKYRYHQAEPARPSTPAPVDTTKPTMHAELSQKDAAALPNADNVTSPFYHMSCTL